MKRIKLPTNIYKKTTVILANGNFPRNKLALQFLENSDFLVCCDGAVNQLLEHYPNRIPDAIVGDCDSISQENIQRFSKIIYKTSEQEANDLTKAVNFCCAKAKTNITILGATGKREDHTLANISLLADYFKFVPEIRIITDNGIFDAIDKDAEFESFVGQQVSIFNINGAIISTSNLKYPVNNRILHRFWEGSLNESIKNIFQIKTDNTVIVYREL